MLCMTGSGCIWEKAVPGSSPRYDDLANGWNKWNAGHSDCSDVCITDSDYPRVGFFDSFIKPPALRRLLLSMLNPDPTRRATMADIISNKWLKTVECCQPDKYDEVITASDDSTTTFDASKSSSILNITKTLHHNHLPPHSHFGHKIV